MADFKVILGGIGQLGLGIILLILFFYIVPAIMGNDIINAGLPTAVKGIIWVGSLALIIGGLIIFPISKVYQGIRGE